MVQVVGKGVGPTSNQSKSLGSKEKELAGSGSAHETALAVSSINTGDKGLSSGALVVTPPQPTVVNETSLVLKPENVNGSANSMALTVKPNPSTEAPNSMALVVKSDSAKDGQTEEIEVPPEGVHKVWGIRSPP